MRLKKYHKQNFTSRCPLSVFANCLTRLLRLVSQQFFNFRAWRSNGISWRVIPRCGNSHWPWEGIYSCVSHELVGLTSWSSSLFFSYLAIKVVNWYFSLSQKCISIKWHFTVLYKWFQCKFRKYVLIISQAFLD